MHEGHPHTLPLSRAVALYMIVAFMLLSGGGPLQMLGLWGVTASLWLLIFVPTLAVVMSWCHELLPSLGVRSVSARHLVASVLLGSSCWFVNAWAVLPLQELVLPVPRDVLDALEKMIMPSGAPLALTLLALVITPAICEELLCRGVLARSLEQRLGLAGAVLLSSLMFALLHFSIYRLAPTFTLGLVLGFAALKTRSVVPAMIIHAFNNLPVALASTVAGAASMQWLYQAGWWPRLLSLVAILVGLRLITTTTQQ